MKHIFEYLFSKKSDLDKLSVNPLYLIGIYWINAAEKHIADKLKLYEIPNDYMWIYIVNKDQIREILEVPIIKKKFFERSGKIFKIKKYSDIEKIKQEDSSLPLSNIIKKYGLIELQQIENLFL